VTFNPKFQFRCVCAINQPVIQKCGQPSGEKMNLVIKPIVAATAIAALSACGGGGDSGTPTPAAGVKYTQSDLFSVAQISALTVDGSGSSIKRATDYLGAFLQGFSTDPLGSRSSSVSCVINGAGTGTATSTISKSAVRVGLAVADQISTTYTNCDFGGLGFVLNGTVKLTAQSAAANLVANNYQVSYEAILTGFSIKQNGVTTNYSGIVNAVSSQTNGNSSSASITVPTGQSFSVTIPNLTTVYASGAALVANESVSPNSANRKLDGNLSYVTAPGTLQIAVSTPTLLAGTINAAGRFIATSGTFNARDTIRNITTSTTVSGNNASVSGDTDGNSSLDFVFSTPWTQLIGL
jgi:hypothetical protein